MTYFQNPFAEDFRGNWVLGDRHHSLTFACPRNAGRGDEIVVSWAEAPFDLSGNDADSNSRDTLVIWYSLHPPFTRWAQLTVDITTAAASTAAVTYSEIITALNADNNFTAWFTAAPTLPIENTDASTSKVQIRSKKDSSTFRYYIANGRAEEALQFNARAGIAELPSYFDRHRVEHLFATLAALESFPDRMNHLIPLDPSNSGGASAVDDDIIDNAVDAFGVSLELDSNTTQEDWQLLKGRSGLFEFTNGPSSAAVASTETEIIYPAGAKIGDLATRIVTELDASSVIVNKFVIPHVLVSADLITPP